MNEKYFMFRMQKSSNKKLLTVNISQKSPGRKVEFKNARTVGVEGLTSYRNTPGELTSAQWRHFKIKPSDDIITDLKANLGKLISYPTLRESFAQMVDHKKQYQYNIEKDGISGTSEIISYHFSKEYLDKTICSSNFEAIENLIMVITKKQLRAQPNSFYQINKAIFVNESMIPRIKCTTMDGTSKTKVVDVLDTINELMQNFVLLSLKISIKRFDECADNFQIVIWRRPPRR